MAGIKRKTSIPSPSKQRFEPTFLEAWRTYLDISQEKSGVRDRTQVGRIERGEQPYTQETLEAFANRYKVQPWQLLVQDPFDKSWVHRFFTNLDQKSREELIDIVKNFKK